ncbi:MAG: tRNA (adenosine(37)-N6)-threonylcarbamoyltransferase complex ATPase subunit type 1 TsaE [Maricaulis sp.]|jgi:tRNA threonylcarbamoyladenosine biosynthesis protein TsaE|nr:tRNA (adenosine(37)-N6)-threonylcarbamoyltransferase complex ATPase subunit type 1 TsaE [Maricaulis sp.]HAQ35817.1 tRNA (adenosine(37)-N6)-threonylcarbamoyltransferase complex ATPase subunit type 1 TsaE [Alphaproteobacteria bacterium]|tara:strand:+ start:289 stop:759 length:471 start_codon:yes stop_codon:yes gene_type:complete
MTALDLSFDLPDPESTAALGAALGARLRAGDTVLLEGDLGAGKTTFARGMIAALCGVTDVPSPTYTLIQSYETADGIALLHADLYRIEDADELNELGLEDAFDDSITLVEWPDRLFGRAPRSGLTLTLTLAPGGRTGHISGGTDWKDRLDGFDPRG